MNGRVVRWASLGLGLCFMASVAHSQPVLAPPAPAKPAPGSTEPLPNRPDIKVGALEVRDITVGPLVIGHGVFSGLQHEGEVVRAKSVQLENVVGVAGERRIAVPEIIATDVTLPAELFRALTQGATNALDGPALLARLSAREVRIPALADDDGTAFTKTAYVNIVLGEVKNGVMASGRIESVAISAGDGDEAATMKTGTVNWRVVDLAEMLRFSTGGQSAQKDDGAKLLVESATIEDSTLTVPGAEVGIGRITLAGFRGRAPDAPANAAPTAPRLMPPGAADPAMAGFARYAAQVLKHAQIDNYSVEGIRVRAPEMGALSIGKVLFAGLSARGLDRFAIEGVELDGAGAGFKLGSFSIEKLNYGKLADIFLKALAAGEEPDIDPGQIAEAAPKIGAIRLAGLAIATPVGPFSLAEAVMDVDDPDADVPERLTLKFTGVKADLRQAPPGTGHEPLVELGYREINADAQMQIRLAPKERAFLVDETWLSVADAGRVDLAVRLGNVEITPAAANPEVAEQIMESAHIEAIELRVGDTGLGDRFFAQVARQAGVSDAEARSTLALDIKTQAIELLGSALAPGAPEAIEAFIRKPGRLVVRVTPKDGQSPLTLGDLDQLEPNELNARIVITIENAAQ